MNKLFSFFLLFCFVLVAHSGLLAQSDEDAHIVYIQTWKFKAMPTGDDAKSFTDILTKQTAVYKDNPRLLSQNVVRHFWGSDSRDLIIINEFKTLEDLFTFNEEMNTALEKAFTKEENDKFNALWTKYVGQHSDEIYREVPGTRK